MIDSSKTIKPCIVCKRELVSVYTSNEAGPSAYDTQPYDAVSFEGRGTYGSAFDDMEGQQKYVVNICDACLTTAINSHEVLQCKSTTTSTYSEATS